MSTAALTLTPPTTVRPLCLLAAGVLALAFLCTEHQLRASQMDEYGTTQEDLEQKAGKSNVFNQAGFTTLALLGGALLTLKGGRPWQVDGVLPVVMLLFLGWCAASLLWSIDPGRTGKRIVIVLFCLLGALGVGRQMAPRELCLVALAVTATFALAGVGIELALGTFKPWGGDYRFAGTMHPNGQGVNCALFCLSAVLLLGGATRTRPLLIGLLTVGAALLILTKSRTSFFGVLLSLAALRALRKPAGLLLVLLGVVLAGAAVVLVALLIGLPVEERFADVVLLGRAEHAATASGRTELWEELLSYVAARPLTGYGYGSFWTPDHIEEISSSQYWGISEAHSLYLEAVLNVGLVGAGLLALTAAGGIVRAARRYRGGNDAAIALTFTLLVFGLFNGLTEADFLMPSFATFATGCGLCHFAFFRGGVS